MTDELIKDQVRSQVGAAWGDWASARFTRTISCELLREL